MTYSDFLFVSLFMATVEDTKTIYEEEKEYDLIYPEVLKHKEAFLKSKYNTDSMPEYACIIDYLHATIVLDLPLF